MKYQPIICDQLCTQCVQRSRPGVAAIFFTLVPLLSGALQAATPEIFDVRIPEDSIRAVEWTETHYVTDITVRRFDSAIVCSGQECHWEYDSVADTTERFTRGTAKIRIVAYFTLFDADNDSCRITPLVKLTYMSYEYTRSWTDTVDIDSAWGDLYARPGLEKTIFLVFPADIPTHCVENIHTSRYHWSLHLRVTDNPSVDTFEYIQVEEFPVPCDGPSAVAAPKTARGGRGQPHGPQILVQARTSTLEIRAPGDNANTEVAILDPLGRRVCTSRFYARTVMEWRLPLLAAGVYSVVITDGERMWRQRIVWQQ